MTKLAFSISLCIIVFMSGCKPKALTPQQKAKEVQTEEANVTKIEALNFTFYPNSVEPEFGVTHMLNNASFFEVSKNRINAQLPFMGRFFLNPMAFNDIPLEFISNKFIYTVDTENGINFHVQITPTDEVSIMNEGIVFNLYLNKQNGEGTLKVKTDNNEEISYFGYFQ